MNSNKLTKILCAVILALLTLSISIFSVMVLSKSNNEIQIEAAVPYIPEGEPILTEDPTEPPTHFPMKGLVLVDRLNVRKEPDINHHVSYQLAIDEEIEVFEINIIDTDDWGSIAWGRITDDMWVNLRYVELEDKDYDFTVQVEYSLDDLHGLAIVNYLEAGQDSCCNLCRGRICDVVLNRVAEDNYYADENTVKEVLTSVTQFSYLWRYYGFVPEKVENIYEQHAIERAYMIAEQILLGNHTDVYMQGYYCYMGINRTDDYIVCHDCGIWFSR